MTKCVLGLERFLTEPPAWVADAAIGLLTHPPAVDSSFKPSYLRLAEYLGARLKALFGPQHGFWGDKQDNMIESPDSSHPLLRVPVYSLYGRVRQPEPGMLEGLDVMLVDLQDVGTRVYTYIHTLRLVMEACGRAGVKVVVLDRPNPIGRAQEGNLLAGECSSFVGLTRLPMRHGLTIGETARLIRSSEVDCELEVVPMAGYDPWRYFEATGLGWVMPSPNMPTVDTAVVYPGQVIFEGTNLSEGRGTTRPFEIVGAPFIDPFALIEKLGEYHLTGVAFRPIFFEPTFNKFAGRTCGGLFVHVTERRLFRPYRTSLAILQAAARLWPDEVTWSDPPYEYEYERRPIDLILGEPKLADDLIDGHDLDELEAGWEEELDLFSASCREYFLY